MSTAEVENFLANGLDFEGFSSGSDSSDTMQNVKCKAKKKRTYRYEGTDFYAYANTDSV